ncbi:hypothetical protein N9Q73_01215 [Flavobacteriaceae bacterium]|nr:hypothetical protein [Flavobacteriaceae bacterium]
MTFPNIAPKQTITVSEPSIPPIPLSMVCDISLMGIPKSTPATMEMIKKAKKGFILPQDMRRISKKTQKATMSIDIKVKTIGL